MSLLDVLLCGYLYFGRQMSAFRNMFLPPSADWVTKLHGDTFWNTPITVVLSFNLECVFRLILPH